MRTDLIQLLGHQARGKFDDAGLQPEVHGRLGRLQPEQSTADHCRLAGTLGVIRDGVQILKRAIYKHTLLVGTVDGGHKGAGAGGQNQLVVRNRAPFLGGHGLGFAIQVHHKLAGKELHALLLVPGTGGHLQVLLVRIGKVRAELHAVVRGAGLLTENGDLIISARFLVDELFAKLVAHHPISNNDNVFRFRGFSW